MTNGELFIPSPDGAALALASGVLCPTCKATNSGAQQTFPSGVFIPIHLNSEVWDTNDMHTGLTGTIIGVNVPAQQFTVSGDITSGLVNGRPFEVTGSTGNDGIYRAATVALVAGNTVITIGTEVSFASAVADGIINYQLSRVYAPMDGFYWVSGRIHFYANTTGLRAVWIVVNSNQFRIAPKWTAGLNVETGVQNDGPLNLNAGDYVEAWAYQQTTPAVNLLTFALGESRTWLQLLRQRDL